MASVNIHLKFDGNCEEAFRLSTEGEFRMAMNVDHWGDYFGICTDRFGISWLINCHQLK